VTRSGRFVLLLVLLIAYGAFFGRWLASGGAVRLDPVGPQARQIEQAIAESRYADAQRIAGELRGQYGSEPLLAYWFAIIHHGLDQPQDEVEWWERFISLGGAPAEACPQIADARARLGDFAEAIGAYERCAALDAAEPERLVDLGDAYRRAGRDAEARAAFERAATLDPGNPVIRHRIEQLPPRRAETR
jgi:tetratricopeptide (TPR) repeat protein